MLRTPVDTFSQASHYESLHLARNAIRQLAQWLRLALQHRCQRRHLRIARKRSLTGEHLVENRAKGENVAARVQWLAFGLLRRHVGSTAQNCALFSPHRRKLCAGLIELAWRRRL